MLKPTHGIRSVRPVNVAAMRRNAEFQQRLGSFAKMNVSNSTCVARAIVLTNPPSIEAREITDKGSINQAAVLKNRADLVEQLYRESPPPNVICVQKECA